MVLILAMALGCRDAPLGPGTDRAPNGTWGGEHISLELTNAGGSLEYDCAHGTIDEPMVLDSKGRFDVKGSHVRERGGPQREGEILPKRPARYTGYTDGKTMSLTVTLTDTVSGETVGTFSLTFRKAARLTKCL